MKKILTLLAALFMVIAVPGHAWSEADSPADPLAVMRAKKISIHGQDFSLPTLLVALGREAGVNVFVSDKVKGKTSLDLDNVSLD